MDNENEQIRYAEAYTGAYSKSCGAWNPGWIINQMKVEGNPPGTAD